MRVVLALLVLAVAFTGCSSKNDDATPSTEASPTPTTGGATTPTGTTPAPTTPPAPTSPAALPPKQIGAGTVSFAGPAPSPATATVKVDPGYTMIHVNVTYYSAAQKGAPFLVAQDFHVKVGGIDCTIGAGPQTGDNAICKDKTATVAPGDLKVEFAGAGAGSGDWKIVESTS